MLKNTATGAAAGAVYGSVLGPEGAAAGAVIGGLVGAATSLFSGGPQAENAQANVGGGSITAYQIYQALKNGSTSSLETGKGDANTLKGLHSNRANAIDALNNRMSSAWQGNAAGAAQGGANALKMWHEDSAKNLGTSQTFITHQIDAFHDVHGKVQELPKDPPQMKWYDHQPFSDKDKEIDKYNQDSQTNVQAYTAYYNASSQNAGGMPQYNVWQGNNISDGTDPGKYGNGPGGTGPGGTGGFSGGPGGVPGGFKPPTSNPSKFDPPKYTPPKTDPSKFDPPKYPPPGGPGRTGDPRFNPPGDGTTTSGWTPPSTNPPTFDPSTFGPSGGGGAGFGPNGGGAGAGGAFGAGGFGVGGFGPGGSGSGAMAGEASGGAAGGLRAGAGAGAGAAGRPGASGMGGMGGGGKGGKGEDDAEHQTKYLLEEDGNDIFGSDQMTVPPVIGE
ncbi:hypothetical protein [Amycolatopsis echigonensis]|nr:hypothetical protein [Amycolatopsis niigatensis]